MIRLMRPYSDAPTGAWQFSGSFVSTPGDNACRESRFSPRLRRFNGASSPLGAAEALRIPAFVSNYNLSRAYAPAASPKSRFQDAVPDHPAEILLRSSFPRSALIQGGGLIRRSVPPRPTTLYTASVHKEASLSIAD